MLQLPVELRRLCIESLNDTTSLKTLRLVNTELGTLATETLFRKAVLNPTDQSAEALTKLMQSRYSHLIRCVAINTYLDPYFECSEESKILKSFAEAIKSLRKLQNLGELQLSFAVECAADWNTQWEAPERDVAETIHFRSEVLWAVFTVLEKTPTLKALTVKNLQDYTEWRVLESTAFHCVRSRLARLHLQITTENQEQREMLARHRGFTIDLPEVWLRPVLSQLTHLTLYSYTCMWGLFPFVDFRLVGTFPCLQSLSLGNFTIAHDWQVDWILSHGPTLKQLLLDDCPIITALSMEEDMAKVAFPNLRAIPQPAQSSWGGRYFTQIPLRWYDIFSRFQSGLPRLRRFAMRSTDRDWFNESFDERYDLSNTLADSRYHHFDCGSVPPWVNCYRRRYGKGYRFFLVDSSKCEEEHVEFPQCHDRDAEALGALMEMVNQRAGTVQSQLPSS